MCLFAAALMCAACGSPSGNDGGSGGSSGNPACQGVAAKTLDQVFNTYFAAGVPTTCLNAGCHASGSGGLLFDSASTFGTATINKAATSDSTKTLVKPFDPDQSWLFEKLLPTAPGQMPSGGPYLDQAGLDAVKGWICAGAPPSGAGGGSGTTPTVTGLTPSSGYVGTFVTIAGTNFSATPASNTVKFSGVPAEVLSATRTALTTHVPPGAATGRVTVTVGTSTATSPADFTALTGNPVPVVSALSPCGAVAGGGGFTLTVNGQNFSASTTATFGGASVPVTFVSATQVTLAIPGSAVAVAPTGNVEALVLTNPAPGGGASLSADFGLASAASTLAAQVQPIFTAQCATAGCHNASATAGGLNLASGAARAQLVGAQSLDCPGKLRVRACSPARALSVLVDKILATPANGPCAGTPMPKGAPLTATEKQRIVDWVAQGAP
jgi:hypothetical protein